MLSLGFRIAFLIMVVLWTAWLVFSIMIHIDAVSFIDLIMGIAKGKKIKPEDKHQNATVLRKRSYVVAIVGLVLLVITLIIFWFFPNDIKILNF